MKTHQYYNVLLSVIAIIHVTQAVSVHRRSNRNSAAIAHNPSGIAFGIKSMDSNSQTSNNQAKRDLSLSYTATDIDSKEGARVKTITVIKNLNKDGKSEKLAINPVLHKNENWANAFRDNFDSYGAIPDVPDIDDLFEFMNKKPKLKPKPIGKMETKAKTPPPLKPTVVKETGMEVEKPVVEPAAEVATESATEAQVAAEALPTPAASIGEAMSNSGAQDELSSPTVEKIKGDAELIPSSVGSGGKRHNISDGGGSSRSDTASATRSQSLSLTKERLREQLIDVNYSTPQHSVRQYFENYVQQNPKGYDYPRPCQNVPTSSVTVSTASGRTYDIPSANSVNGANNGVINPYIAPAVAKKPPPTLQVLQPEQPQSPLLPPPQNFPPLNQNQPAPGYSVNSILPPLQPTPGGFQATSPRTTLQPPTSALPPPRPLLPNLQPQPIATQQPPVQQQSVSGGFSTSQRPYVAPSLRNGLGISRGPSAVPVYRGSNVSPNYRTNIFGGVGVNNKPNAARSRGLKY